jgi:hypothetical protein
MSLCIDDRLVCMFRRDSSKPSHQTAIYTEWHIPDVVLIQFSWWWAHGCPKHVENRNKHTCKRLARQIGYLQRLYQNARSTEHKIPRISCTSNWVFFRSITYSGCVSSPKYPVWIVHAPNYAVIYTACVVQPHFYCTIFGGSCWKQNVLIFSPHLPKTVILIYLLYGAESFLRS